MSRKCTAKIYKFISSFFTCIHESTECNIPSIKELDNACNKYQKLYHTCIYNYLFVLRYIANRFYSQEMISERKSTNSLHFISYVVTTSNAYINPFLVNRFFDSLSSIHRNKIPPFKVGIKRVLQLNLYMRSILYEFKLEFGICEIFMDR